MTDAEGPIFTLSLDGSASLFAGTHVLSAENIRFVTENAFDKSAPDVVTKFEVTEEQATSLLSPQRYAPTDVYDIHGRVVRKGTASLEDLQKGVYIVNKQKMIR
jgi:hypothetical protein